MQRMASIALSLLLASSYGMLLTGRGTADAKSTVKIDIINKQYQPPSTTPVIPTAFEQQGARLALHAGDTVEICNHDQFVMEPFSPNKGFTDVEKIAPAGKLQRGKCMSFVVANNSGSPIWFKLFDQIHARNKLFIVVLPKNWPDQGEMKTPPDRRVPSEGKEYPLSESGEILGEARELTLTLGSASVVVQLSWANGKLTTGKYTAGNVPLKVDQSINASASLGGPLPSPYVMWLFVGGNGGPKAIDGQCGPTPSGCEVQVPAYPGRARGYGDGWAASVPVEVWICPGARLQDCPADPAAAANINWHL